MVRKWSTVPISLSYTTPSALSEDSLNTPRCSFVTQRLTDREVGVLGSWQACIGARGGRRRATRRVRSRCSGPTRGPRRRSSTGTRTSTGRRSSPPRCVPPLLLHSSPDGRGAAKVQSWRSQRRIPGCHWANGVHTTRTRCHVTVPLCGASPHPEVSGQRLWFVGLAMLDSAV
jgi:hypothetical protein